MIIIRRATNDGDDKNNGETPETALKTVTKAHEYITNNKKSAKNNAKFAIRFRRGDIFRGNIQAQGNVTYAAYGEGRKPRIYGSTENGAGEGKWTLVDEAHHIWKYNKKFTRDIGGIFFINESNEVEAHGYKEIPSWDISKQKFVLRLDHSRDFVMTEQLDNDLDFFWDGHDVINSKNMPDIEKKYRRSISTKRHGRPGQAFSRN